MAKAGIKELLGAGVHFGHQTRRWNPRMGRFIWGEREGIHIIDLEQTETMLERAARFAAEVAGRGGTVLFVGTKKQARDAVEEWATRCEMPHVNLRWLGGLLTNFSTMSKRIERLHELTGLRENGQLELLPTKERITMEKELASLEHNLGGVRDMRRQPDVVFITDLKTEEIALREAVRLRIPVIALCDTNVDPTEVDHPIPGNDDSMRSLSLVVSTIGEAIEGSAQAWREAEAKRRAEEEERKRREAEERRRLEEEKKAKAEAEEKAKAEAEQRARAEAQGQARAAEQAAPPAPSPPAADAPSASTAAEPPATGPDTRATGSEAEQSAGGAASESKTAEEESEGGST